MKFSDDEWCEDCGEDGEYREEFDAVLCDGCVSAYCDDDYDADEAHDFCANGFA